MQYCSSPAHFFAMFLKIRGAFLKLFVSFNYKNKGIIIKIKANRQFDNRREWELCSQNKGIIIKIKARRQFDNGRE